jgi:hypothetical protein
MNYKGELIKDGDLRKKSFNKLFDQHPAGTIQVSTTLYASSETNPGWLFDSSGLIIHPRHLAANSSCFPLQERM